MTHTKWYNLLQSDCNTYTEIWNNSWDIESKLQHATSQFSSPPASIVMWVTWNSWLLGHQRVTSDLPTSQQKTCDLAHLMHLTHQLHWNTSSQMCSRSILYIWIRIQEDALFHPGQMHGSGGYMCYLFLMFHNLNQSHWNSGLQDVTLISGGQWYP